MGPPSRALRASLALNALLCIAAGVWIVRRVTAPSAGEAAASGLARWREERRSVLAGLEPRAGGLVIVGDSLVERGEWAELLDVPGAKNRGVAGDTTADVLARIDGVLAPPPDRVVLLAGTNDLEQGIAVEDVARSHDRVLARARERAPAAEIVIVGVPPVREGLADPRLRNDAIAALDALLAELARARGCRFVDARGVLADAAGQLDARFTLDGVHLNGTGYATLGTHVRAALAASR